MGVKCGAGSRAGSGVRKGETGLEVGVQGRERGWERGGKLGDQDRSGAGTRKEHGWPQGGSHGIQAKVWNLVTTGYSGPHDLVVMGNNRLQPN